MALKAGHDRRLVFRSAHVKRVLYYNQYNSWDSNKAHDVTIVLQLNLDFCLHIMMEVWMEQRSKDLDRVCTIFQQVHSVGAGVVSVGDFKAMMRAIDLDQASMVPDHVVTAMFREAVKLSEDGNVVMPNAFFQVRIGFASCLLSLVWLMLPCRSPSGAVPAWNRWLEDSPAQPCSSRFNQGPPLG